MAGALAPLPSAAGPASLIEDLGSVMAVQYAVIEERLIELVAAYARQQIETPLDVSERLRIIRDLKDASFALLDDVNPARLAAEVIAIAESEGSAAAVRRLGLIPEASIDTTFSPSSASAIGQMSLELTGKLTAMSPRILRWAPDAFQRVTALTSSGVLGGVDTIGVAERRAVEKYLAKGITFFPGNGPDAHPWRIGSYAEMSTRTAVNRAWQQGNIDRLHQNDLQLVQIIGGADACQYCARHFGRVYSTDGTAAGVYTLTSMLDGSEVSVEVAGTLDDARSQGWNHPNCRCVIAAVLPGLTLASDATAYDPAKEAARDKLRYLEREERNAKRRELAALDDVEKATWKAKVKRRREQIAQHVEATGVKRKPYREQLSFSDGRRTMPTLPKPRAVSAPASAS